MDTIVLRTTNECNLRCTYCYDCGNHDSKISRQIATNQFEKNEDAIIDDVRKILSHSKRPRLIFHGGEPLLVDADLLSDFCTRLYKILPIKFSIQTNATLIDSKVIKFFKDNEISVGISLDGADKIQNGARNFKNGTNSFDTVMQKIKLLQGENIRFGAVISVNKLHIGQEQKLYDFLAENRLKCNIRPVFATKNGDNSLVMTTDEYISFFNNLFDIWYEDKDKRVSTGQITDFYEQVQRALSQNVLRKSCECSPNCFANFISLDTNGEVYSCNRLYNIEEFHYGNIRNLSIAEIEAKAYKLIEQRTKAIEIKCASCENLKDCYGGCPAEAYSTYGTISEPSNYCHIRTEIAKHVKEKVLV